MSGFLRAEDFELRGSPRHPLFAESKVVLSTIGKRDLGDTCSEPSSTTLVMRAHLRKSRAAVHGLSRLCTSWPWGWLATLYVFACCILAFSAVVANTATDNDVPITVPILLVATFPTSVWVGAVVLFVLVPLFGPEPPTGILDRGLLVALFTAAAVAQVLLARTMVKVVQEARRRRARN